MRNWITTLCLCLAALGAQAAAGHVEGKVTRVVDGDSLWLEPAAPAAPVELRLVGIDAPEICQDWGREARTALSELVQGREVSVRTVGRDVHGRTLGTVYLGTQNVNLLMVQEGHAWSSRYKYDRGPYVAAERMAKALNRGLNRDANALMPHQFRQQHGPCEAGAPVVATGKAVAAAPAAPALATPASGYRCDGRTRCSQMSSCGEATWFLKNCPGVEMDGDHDGVPCERQWCQR